MYMEGDQVFKCANAYCLNLYKFQTVSNISTITLINYVTFKVDLIYFLMVGCTLWVPNDCVSYLTS